MKKSKRTKKRGMMFGGKHQVKAASEALKTMQTEYKDADDFVFTFDDDVPENEREYYAKQYSRIDQVRVERSHCTTCDLHIGTAPIVEKTLRTHPVLKVTHCNKCFVFYNSGEFGTGEDGSEFYCRWCGQGGEVFCCSSCPYVFCIKCIRTNLGVSFVREIEKKDDWLCFVCDKTILLRMRANHWALQNYIAKQMAIIKTIGDESKINTLLNDDNSICCPRKKRRLLTLKGSGAVANMINIKRSFPISSATPAQPPQKKAAIADSSKQNPSIPSKSNGNNEIVCTPDILGLLDDKASPSTAVSLQRKSATKKTNNKVPPITPASKGPIVRMMVPTTSAEQSQKGAIYHTVSGFQIDLNQAARQPIYRLPSGKLIQVRKETSNNNVQGLRPQLLAPIPRETSITVRPNALNSRHRMPLVMQPNQFRGAVRTQMRVPLPTTNQRFTISDGRVMSHISHPNNHSQTSTTSSGHVGLTANTQQNGQYDGQTPQASTIFTQQNGTISVSRAAHPDTPFGKAKIEFEDKIISGMEICQHTINKMITLSNSTPFKSAKKFQDIKDLYIHLQYLFQYTSGKFATLQESLATSMEGLVEFDPTLKEKTEDDELEIVEDKRDTIEIDASEDESDKEDKDVSVPLSTKDSEIAARQLSSIEDIQEPSNIANNETISLVNRIHMKNPFVHIQYVNKATENEEVTVQPTSNVDQSPKEVTTEKINEIEIETSGSKITLKPCVVKVERLEDSRDEAIIEMLHKVTQSGTTILRTLRSKSKRKQSLESEKYSDDDLIENSIQHSNGKKQVCGPKSSKTVRCNVNLDVDNADILETLETNQERTDIEESNDQNDMIEVIRSDNNATKENGTRSINVPDDVPKKALAVEDIPEDNLTDEIRKNLEITVATDDAEKDEESNLDVVLKITKDKVNTSNSSTENESHAVTANSVNELNITVISNDSVTDEEKLADVTVENLKEIDNTVSPDDNNKETEEDKASKNTKKLQHTESEEGVASEKISLDAAGSSLNDLNKRTTNENQNEKNLVTNDSSEITLENNKPIVVEEHINDKNCVIMKDHEVSIILTDIFDTVKENTVSNKKLTVNINNIEKENDQTNKKDSEIKDTSPIDIDEKEDSSKPSIGSPEIVLEEELQKTDVSSLFNELKSLTEDANFS